MSTTCYAMVRGSAIRATGLTTRGGFPVEIPYAVSTSVAKITINEVSEGGSTEVLRTPEDEIRVVHIRPAETTRFGVDIEFLRCDPALLSLMTNVPLVENANGDIVGFDAYTRVPVAAFGLEVWSRITGVPCEGERPWGYTLFPFLKGGYLTGFQFSNGLVSFNLVNARCQRGAKWSRGPYDLGDGPLPSPVSRNTNFRQMLLTTQPPAQTEGVLTFSDVLDGGTPDLTTPDIVDGGEPDDTTEDIIDGGLAV